MIDHGNRERVLAVQERRRSNASGKHHDKRTKRNRSRSAQKARAIKEYS
jgi:hypothetical protein